VQTPTSTDPAASVNGGDGVSQAKSRATEMGRQAADAIAQGIDAAASTLHSRAESLPGGEKVARAAQGAADAMEKAAGYVRDQDLKGMLSDIQQAAKRHPGATLLAAAALGLVLARTFSRD
jgi:hypothetical protein